MLIDIGLNWKGRFKTQIEDSLNKPKKNKIKLEVC